jgi:hypothetical protein
MGSAAALVSPLGPPLPSDWRRRRMSVKDDIIKILQSRGRVERGTTDEPEPDIVNVQAAVREVQDAVVKLAEEIDSLSAGSTRSVRVRLRASEEESAGYTTCC